ncbi:hypothetical protein CEXT_751121 [Caerostris extrusa]|uniref:Uncharacterized protein n=1 Tax=Caerostris extrusa TaxID=172846 RepID=A0AAV4MM05_CAEEX|nr:hypothetical protein CEXT_751121 [Caerostris extrusa]
MRNQSSLCIPQAKIRNVRKIPIFSKKALHLNCISGYLRDSPYVIRINKSATSSKNADSFLMRNVNNRRFHYKSNIALLNDGIFRFLQWESLLFDLRVCNLNETRNFLAVEIIPFS